MARDFAKVRSRFWTGETGKKIRALGPDARVIATYLLTCASSNMIGLYYLPISLLSHETGRGIKGALEDLRSLESVGFAYYDSTEEVVFVPNMAAEQIEAELQAGDKRCAGVARELKEYEKSRFFAAFVARYKGAFHLPDSMGDGSPLQGPCEPLRSQEQEQENDQEKENEHEQEIAARAAARAKGKKSHDATEGFLKFWSAYPRKVAKGLAIKAWPGDEFTDRILAALSWQVPTWTEVQFMKHPTTWLHARCWEDEKPTNPGPNRPQQPSLRVGHARAEDFDHSQTGEIKL